MSFQHPMSCIINGPSHSGKSQFALHIQIQPPPEKIYYFYGAWNKQFSKYKNIKFIKGIPDEDFEFNPKLRTLIYIDDLSNEICNNAFVYNLFVKDVHHGNKSVILITHNLFNPGKYFRTISLNTNYMVLFKSIRDTQQIGVLDRQMYGCGSTFLQNVYKACTLKPFGYLVINFKQQTPDCERLSTGVLQTDGPVYYFKKDESQSSSQVPKRIKKKKQKPTIKKRKRSPD
jgi:hypothetical protein